MTGRAAATRARLQRTSFDAEGRPPAPAATPLLLMPSLLQADDAELAIALATYGACDSAGGGGFRCGDLGSSLGPGRLAGALVKGEGWLAVETPQRLVC